MRPDRNIALIARIFVLLATLLVVSACSQEPPPAEPSPAELAPTEPDAAPTKPLTLDEVIRRTHFAFRREGGAWTGGHTTYAVRVSEEALRVAPHAGETAGAELELRTEAIQRGDVRLGDGPARSATDVEGKLRIVRGEVVEQLQNTEDGVEQSWLFEERPEGKGDLTITVRVSGQDYVGETVHGHHFADKEKGLGLRYGRATWIDARGEKTDVPVAYADGALALRVPSAVVDGSSYPAVLDPTIGPEMGIDESVMVPARNDQTEPAVAYGNGQFLVVWTDNRASGGSAASEIYGVRVKTDGTVLDNSGIPISRGTGARTQPAVASDGTNWMVVWRDTRTSNDGHIYGAGVDANGTVLHPNGIPIATTNLQKTYPAIAFDGTNYLVVYRQTSAYGVMLAPSGVVLSPAPFTILPESFSYPPGVAFNGTHYLVAAGGRYRRVATDGSLVDTSSKTYSTSEWEGVSVTSNGEGWLIAFKNYASSTYYVQAMRVAADGTGTTSNVAAAVNSGTTKIRAAFAGAAYVVSWWESSLIRAARVNANTGAVVTGPTNLVTTGESPTEPHVAIGGSTLLVTYRSTKTTLWASGSDIYGQRFSASDLTAIDASSTLLARGANQELNPAVAFNGTNYLVVWEDRRHGSLRAIYGARIDQAGEVLDPAGIRLSQAANEQVSPAVASNGTDWLVAWQDGRPGASQDDIYGTRVGADGSVKDILGIQISAGTSASGQQQTPAVASDGTDYFVAWSTATRVWGARVQASSGNVLDANGIQFTTTSSNQPDVSFGNQDYLVVWNASSNVHGRRVTKDGTLLGSSAIVIAEDGVQATMPKVAFDGTNWFVVWQANKIRGARVDTSGEVLDAAFDLSTSGTIPSLTWDGTQYWAAWQTTGTPSVYAVRVAPNKTVKDSPALLVASDALGTSEAAIAAGGAKKVLVAYQRYDHLQPYGSLRIRAKFIDDRQPNGTACTQSEECASGFCTDGVCCETECSGTCQACTAAKKGSGADGVCGFVAVGTDPKDHCQDEGAASCGKDGFCNGAGACRLYAAGTTCGDASCNGTQAFQPVCNGSGSCQQPQSGTECAPYACTGGGCKTSCVSEADCVNGNYCDAGVCKPKLTAGAACSINAQCTTGFCTDGVCCDTACTGSCQACTAAKKGSGVDGVCAAIKAGTDPDAECSDQGAASCGTDGYCNGAGACQVYAYGTPCGGTCNGNSSEGKICNGSGSCITAAGSTPCAPFACSSGLCKTSCSTNADCASGFQCVSGDCRDVRANGEACTAGAQCLSGFCVDGVCCDSSCGGTCQACSAAKKGSGVDGVCGFIATGADPDDECTSQPASTCGTTGACNGAGACQLHPSGTNCGSPICQGTVLKTPVCNGSGTCSTPASGQECAPFACSGGACKTSCTTNGDCASGRVCMEGLCISPLQNGAACTAGSQCQSGFCADGVCCNEACDGECEACTASLKGSGSDGTCGSIAAGTDPDDECDAEAEASCGRNGFCDGKGACQLYAAGTSCGSSICQGNNVQGQVCNGNGTCVTSAGTACAPYVCSAGACKNPCTNSNECQAGFFCQSGVCKALGANGTPCSDKSECQSGFCVDGVCCNQACTGKCMACSASLKGQGSDGTCDPIRSGSDPQNECAAQAPSTCGFDGFCDGQGECGVYAAGTVCKAAGCAASEETTASICDGAGTCVAGTTTSCVEGYACIDGACATFCEDDDACAPGYVCDLSFQGCVPDEEGPADAGTDGASDAGDELDGGDETDGGEETDGGDVGPDASIGDDDAGLSDAGTEGGLDGDLAPWEVESDEGGCGCRVAGGESSNGRLGAASLLGLVALVLARRKAAANLSA